MDPTQHPYATDRPVRKGPRPPSHPPPQFGRARSHETPRLRQQQQPHRHGHRQTPTTNLTRKSATRAPRRTCSMCQEPQTRFFCPSCVSRSVRRLREKQQSTFQQRYRAQTSLAAALAEIRLQCKELDAAVGYPPSDTTLSHAIPERWLRGLRIRSQRERCKRLEQQLQQARSELVEERRTMAATRKELAAKKLHVTNTTKDLSARRVELVTNVQTAVAHLSHEHKLLQDSAAQHYKELVERLLRCYVIKRFDDHQCTICGIRLSDAAEYLDNNVEDPSVSAALGYIVFVLLQMASYANLTLPYAMVYQGSRSYIALKTIAMTGHDGSHTPSPSTRARRGSASDVLEDSQSQGHGTAHSQARRSSVASPSAVAGATPTPSHLTVPAAGARAGPGAGAGVGVGSGVGVRGELSVSGSLGSSHGSRSSWGSASSCIQTTPLFLYQNSEYSGSFRRAVSVLDYNIRYMCLRFAVPASHLRVFGLLPNMLELVQAISLRRHVVTGPMTDVDAPLPPSTFQYANALPFSVSGVTTAPHAPHAPHTPQAPYTDVGSQVLVRPEQRRQPGGLGLMTMLDESYAAVVHTSGADVPHVPSFPQTTTGTTDHRTGSLSPLPGLSPAHLSSPHRQVFLAPSPGRSPPSAAPPAAAAGAPGTPLTRPPLQPQALDFGSPQQQATTMPSLSSPLQFNAHHFLPPGPNRTSEGAYVADLMSPPATATTHERPVAADPTPDEWELVDSRGL